MYSDPLSALGLNGGHGESGMGTVAGYSAFRASEPLAGALRNIIFPLRFQSLASDGPDTDVHSKERCFYLSWYCSSTTGPPP